MKKRRWDKDVHWTLKLKIENQRLKEEIIDQMPDWVEAWREEINHLKDKEEIIRLMDTIDNMRAEITNLKIALAKRNETV